MRLCGALTCVGDSLYQNPLGEGAVVVGQRLPLHYHSYTYSHLHTISGIAITVILYTNNIAHIFETCLLVVTPGQTNSGCNKEVALTHFQTHAMETLGLFSLADLLLYMYSW